MRSLVFYLLVYSNELPVATSSAGAFVRREVALVVWNQCSLAACELEGTDENVEILAFPCNQFGSQEPKSNEEIKSFASGKGVKFIMMDKIDVNGPNASLVYKYLKAKAAKGPRRCVALVSSINEQEDVHATLTDKKDKGAMHWSRIL